MLDSETCIEVNIIQCEILAIEKYNYSYIPVEL